MKIDFEKVLADYGLKVGDKVKINFDLDSEIFEIANYKGIINLKPLDNNSSSYVLASLGLYDFEKVEPKKEKVYTLLDYCGGIILNLGGYGKCYLTYEAAKKACDIKNDWAKSKGYSKFEIVELRVAND